MGKLRKWDKNTLNRVKQIHGLLKDDPASFYHGSTAISIAWRKLYPQERIPPLRTIGKMLKDLGLTQRPRGRQKGASRYLCYPEHTVYEMLGDRVLESDFIGQKYIYGRTAPIHFIGFSFKREPKLRYFKRVKDYTASSFISECTKFFNIFEKPDCIKLDNAASNIGSRSGKRNLSRTMSFLLKNEVIPIFSVPKRPFSQASIEGNNSVFARKFWNTRRFECLEQIDEQLEWFNKDSLSYCGYSKPKFKKAKKEFEPKVYFLRQVRNLADLDKGFIEVLNETIILPSEYIQYFVIAEWDLIRENLSIFIEQEKELNLINRTKFLINEKSKQKNLY